jgi:hypothetical protein
LNEVCDSFETGIIYVLVLRKIVTGRLLCVSIFLGDASIFKNGSELLLAGWWGVVVTAGLPVSAGLPVTPAVSRRSAGGQTPVQAGRARPVTGHRRPPGGQNR